MGDGVGRWACIVAGIRGRGGWGVELWVADCDDAVVFGGGGAGPVGAEARGGGFEVGEDGGEGGVVVACR